MSHDPERDAGRFLGGDLSAREQESFSAHLLECAECWRELAEARRGRTLAEGLRTAAPAALRERVRGLVDADALGREAAPPGPRRWPRPGGGAVAAAVVLVLVLVLGGGTTEPPSLRQAVADFSAEQLPGSALPEQRAPDLSGLRLQPVGAGGGDYAGLDVDGYAYRDPAGRRVVLYLSDRPFPEAPGAQRLAGEDGPWVARRGDVTVLCARVPHALLVVGRDAELVRSAARALGVL